MRIFLLIILLLPNYISAESFWDPNSEKSREIFRDLKPWKNRGWELWYFIPNYKNHIIKHTFYRPGAFNKSGRFRKFEVLEVFDYGLAGEQKYENLADCENWRFREDSTNIWVNVQAQTNGDNLLTELCQ